MIVIADSVYALCLRQFWRVLQSPAWEGYFLSKAEFPRMNMEELRETNRAILAVLRRPWWKRAAFAAPWDERFAACIGGTVIGRAQAAERERGWRLVSTRGVRSWIEGTPKRVAQGNEDHDALIGNLDTSNGYFEWIERGGDADVGRYLAIFLHDCAPE